MKQKRKLEIKTKIVNHTKKTNLQLAFGEGSWNEKKNR